MSKNVKKKKGGVVTYKGVSLMPLNKRSKNNEIYEATYGSKKGEEVFYASLNKGKIKRVKKKKKRS